MGAQNLLLKYNIVLLLAAFIVVSSILSPHFLTLYNVMSLLQYTSFIGLLSLGMLLVLLTGEIDLSVGAILAFAGVFITTLTQGKWFAYMPQFLHPVMPTLELRPVVPVPMILALGLVLGGALGWVNGVLVARFGIASFVATLGVMTLARGMAFTYTGGAPIYGEAPLVQFLGDGRVLGQIPIPVLLWVVLLLVAHYVLAHTRAGRSVYAVGGDAEAARLSGISVRAVKAGVFVASGVLAALAGIVVSGKLVTADPRVGTGWELDAIAAAVIGGTSLFGGLGTVIGTAAGALILQLINNILNLTNVNVHLQPILKGAILIIAVYSNRLIQTRAAEANIRRARDGSSVPAVVPAPARGRELS